MARKNDATTLDQILYMAFELSKTKWKLGFSSGLGQRPRIRTMEAGDLEQLGEEIRVAKERFGLAADSDVVSCYEAGRDGFWIHRSLESIGVRNLVVDPGSVPVNRRGRRAKTDRLDVGGLLLNLIKYELGETDVWSVVRVPSEMDEDARHLHRQLEALKRERTRHVNRIKAALFAHGVEVPLGKGFMERVENVLRWDGTPLPPGVKARVCCEYRLLETVQALMAEIEAERRRVVREGTDASAEMVRQLLGLRGVGMQSSWLLVMELFAWRRFENGKQVGSLAGLTPTPYDSGGSRREQGIGKDGIRSVRSMAIELAWCWVRLQPQSKRTLWFNERFADGSKRVRKIGIVAVARRLLIDLWRYLEHGVVPEGAQLKRATA